MAIFNQSAYYAILRESIRLHAAVPFDCFVRLDKNNRIIKFLTSNDSPNQDTFERFKNFGVQNIYIKNEDLDKYKDYLKQFLGSKEGEDYLISQLSQNPTASTSPINLTAPTSATNSTAPQISASDLAKLNAIQGIPDDLLQEFIAKKEELLQYHQRPQAPEQVTANLQQAISETLKETLAPSASSAKVELDLSEWQQIQLQKAQLQQLLEKTKPQEEVYLDLAPLLAETLSQSTGGDQLSQENIKQIMDAVAKINFNLHSAQEEESPTTEETTEEITDEISNDTDSVISENIDNAPESVPLTDSHGNSDDDTEQADVQLVKGLEVPDEFKTVISSTMDEIVQVAKKEEFKKKPIPKEPITKIKGAIANYVNNEIVRIKHLGGDVSDKELQDGFETHMMKVLDTLSDETGMDLKTAFLPTIRNIKKNFKTEIMKVKSLNPEVEVPSDIIVVKASGTSKISTPKKPKKKKNKKVQNLDQNTTQDLQEQIQIIGRLAQNGNSDVHEKLKKRLEAFQNNLQSAQTASDDGTIKLDATLLAKKEETATKAIVENVPPNLINFIEGVKKVYDKSPALQDFVNNAEFNSLSSAEDFQKFYSRLNFFFGQKQLQDIPLTEINEQQLRVENTIPEPKASSEQNKILASAQSEREKVLADLVERQKKALQLFKDQIEKKNEELTKSIEEKLDLESRIATGALPLASESEASAEMIEQEQEQEQEQGEKEDLSFHQGPINKKRKKSKKPVDSTESPAAETHDEEKESIRTTTMPPQSIPSSLEDNDSPPIPEPSRPVKAEPPGGSVAKTELEAQKKEATKEYNDLRAKMQLLRKDLDKINREKTVLMQKSKKLEVENKRLASDRDTMKQNSIKMESQLKDLERNNERLKLDLDKAKKGLKAEDSDKTKAETPNETEKNKKTPPSQDTAEIKESESKETEKAIEAPSSGLDQDAVAALKKEMAAARAGTEEPSAPSTPTSEQASTTAPPTEEEIAADPSNTGPRMSKEMLDQVMDNVDEVKAQKSIVNELRNQLISRQNEVDKLLSTIETLQRGSAIDKRRAEENLGALIKEKDRTIGKNLVLIDQQKDTVRTLSREIMSLKNEVDEANRSKKKAQDKLMEMETIKLQFRKKEDGLNNKISMLTNASSQEKRNVAKLQAQIEQLRQEKMKLAAQSASEGSSKEGMQKTITTLKAQVATLQQKEKLAEKNVAKNNEKLAEVQHKLAQEIKKNKELQDKLKKGKAAA